MSDLSLPLDLPVAARMGLQGCLAAVLLENDGIVHEVALQQPGFLPSGESWSVIEHFDCDPDHDTRGTSGVDGFDTREEAVAEFRRIVSGYDRKIPGYLVCGSDAYGKQIYLARDEFSSGYPYFTDSKGLAQWFTSVAAASDMLSRVGKVPTERQIEVQSFGVRLAHYLTRSVSADAVSGSAPSGWTFVVSESEGSSFKTPERHWMRSGGIHEAMVHSELSEARSACGDGDRPLMVSRRIEPAPLTEEAVNKLISWERYAKAGEPEITPEAGAAYSPK